MSAATAISEFNHRGLSIPDRIALVQEILGGIAADSRTLQPMSEELRAELRRRVADDEANPGQGVPWEEIWNGIDRLSSTERLSLIDQILDTVDAEDVPTEPISEAHIELLRERIRDADAHPETGIPWEVVLAKLEGKV